MTQSSSLITARRVSYALLFLSFTCAISCTANVPTLEWDPNPEPYIAGYNVYTGEMSRNYTRVIDVGMQTSLPLTNLNAGVTYFFAVTAYDAERLESPFSDEVLYTPAVDGASAVVLPCTFSYSREAQTVRFSGYAGQQCRIVASFDLLEWDEVSVVTLPDSGFGEYQDTAANIPTMRFYRVIASAP
jgi:hypothetical protein